MGYATVHMQHINGVIGTDIGNKMWYCIWKAHAWTSCLCRLWSNHDQGTSNGGVKGHIPCRLNQNNGITVQSCERSRAV